ncbi:MULTISPECIES: hypothetical protein [Streptomyces]|uniref:Uncharacterized protein n=2 Tax=Streptomyces TaxID=1883 RepID=A0ABU4K468_9ACTN|nr:hypothetical protein [Streptomyces roseolus]MDX2292550.1 hypothetical protein [Streptomyces roseolus]
MNPPPDAGPDAAEAWDDLLRAEFARAAHDVTPGPAPVAEVVREGRARRRRRTVALSFLAVLGVSAAVAAGAALTGDPPPAAGLAAPPVLVVPTTATTAPTTTTPATTVPTTTAPAANVPAPPVSSAPSAPRTSDGGAQVPAPVRTVAAGERVAAAPGWTVWLTDRGKHWKGGVDGLEQFRSVTDGNLDLRRPGLSHQGEGTFHSGVYFGTRDAGRVDLVDTRGRTTPATLLTLPGSPGWGVWYAVAPDETPVGARLYDRTGRLLSELPAV